MSQLSSAPSRRISNWYKKLNTSNDMICDEILSTVALLNFPNSFLVTGKTPTRSEVCSGLQILKLDLKTIKTTHEEADVFIPNLYHRMFLLHQQKCSKQSSAHAHAE